MKKGSTDDHLIGECPACGAVYEAQRYELAYNNDKQYYMQCECDCSTIIFHTKNSQEAKDILKKYDIKYNR